MTGRPGVMVIREGQYALALLAGPASVQGLRINQRLDVQGDILPHAIPLLIADVLMLAAGVRPPGLAVCSVVEP